MTRSEVLSTFTNVNCARIDAGFAPHKPITILLLLEMVASGHENQFSYREFDSNLRRLLERYGSPSAADARNEPFWRLKNDGILEVTAPFSLLVESARTPTPAQLFADDAVAKMPDGLFQSLSLSLELIADAARAVATKFLKTNVRRAIIAEAAPSIANALRNYWWVSQNQTYGNGR
jgi:predicted restriction endonuclease